MGLLQYTRNKGIQQGEATILLKLMEEKFGNLADDLKIRIQSADSETLMQWSIKLLKAESIDDIFSSMEK